MFSRLWAKVAQMLCVVKQRGKRVELKEQTVKECEENFQDMIIQIRRRQHEFDNHLNAIYGMHLTINDYDELVKKQNEYCDRMLEVNKYNKMISCQSSPIILGFLYGKFLEAENQNITIIPHIVIEKAQCKIMQYELIEVLGILIDNAVQAVTDNECVRRKIKVEIIEYKERVEITIENICNHIPINILSRFFDKGYSTKGKNRGLGLYNLAEIAKKSRSEISVENVMKDNENWLSITLRIPK